MGRLHRGRDERGFMMAALLVTMSVMAVLMGVLMPVWNTAARREREAELVFRGEQYARAIALFQRKYANARPPSVDVLLNERFLRKKYKDPITGDDFEILQGVPGAQTPGGGRGGAAGAGGPGGGAAGAGGRQGAPPPAARGQATPSPSGFGEAGQPLQATTGQGAGIAGFVSKSKEQSFRIYNGQQKYSDWVFTPVQATTQAGVGGAQDAAGRGRGQSGDPSGAGGVQGGSRGGARGGTNPFGTPRGAGTPPPPSQTPRGSFGGR